MEWALWSQAMNLPTMRKSKKMGKIRDTMARTATKATGMEVVYLKVGVAFQQLALLTQLEEEQHHRAEKKRPVQLQIQGNFASTHGVPAAQYVGQTSKANGDSQCHLHPLGFSAIATTIAPILLPQDVLSLSQCELTWIFMQQSGPLCGGWSRDWTSCQTKWMHAGNTSIYARRCSRVCGLYLKVRRICWPKLWQTHHVVRTNLDRSCSALHHKKKHAQHNLVFLLLQHGSSDLQGTGCLA